MTDVYAFGEGEARRIAREVVESERERAQIGNTTGEPDATRQMRPVHKLPAATTGATGKMHVVLEGDGFDFTDLHNPCSDADLVEVTSTDSQTFEANETAFFEGVVFEQEIALAMMFAGKMYLVGGNHICVVGTKLDEGGVLYIVLDDCPDKRVEFEWLSQPDDPVDDGTGIIGLYVKSKNKYVAVLVDCEPV